MLEDVQERLVYRTHIYIREEILNYNPSPGDLSYPEKLEIMEKIAQEQELRQQQSQMKRSESTSSGEMSMSMSINSETGSLSGDNPNRSSSTRMSPQDQHGMWFPTLRRTLICLSKLYRCLDVSSKYSFDTFIVFFLFNFNYDIRTFFLLQTRKRRLKGYPKRR